jgi:hypothetical protein
VTTSGARYEGVPHMVCVQLILLRHKTMKIESYLEHSHAVDNLGQSKVRNLDDRGVVLR